MDKVFRCMKLTMNQTTRFATLSSTHRLQDTIYVMFHGCWHISVKPRLTRAPLHSKVTLANYSLICASFAEIFVQPGATQDGDGSKASPKKNLNEVLNQAKALAALTSKDLRRQPLDCQALQAVRSQGGVITLLPGAYVNQLTQITAMNDLVIQAMVPGSVLMKGPGRILEVPTPDTLFCLGPLWKL